MGLPALRQDHAARAAKSHLRLVPKAKPRGAARATSRTCSSAAARRNCQIFSAVVVFFALLGVARVWMTVQAAESSLQAGQLRESIRQERYKGDMLEVRQSALGSPSRIRAIAGKAMGMTPAAKVDYLDLSAKPKTAEKPVKKAGKSKVAVKPAAQKAEVASASGLAGTLSKIIDLTAGEAQVLLVGDVGLASVR